MKYLIIGVSILCLLIGLCWFAEHEISTRTHQIAEALELALFAVRAGDDTMAKTYTVRAAAAWAEHEAVLASLISHDHTNDIAEDLAQLSWLRGHALGQALEALLEQVRGLEEMERIVWKNILQAKIIPREKEALFLGNDLFHS